MFPDLMCGDKKREPGPMKVESHLQHGLALRVANQLKTAQTTGRPTDEYPTGPGGRAAFPFAPWHRLFARTTKSG